MWPLLSVFDVLSLSINNILEVYSTFKHHHIRWLEDNVHLLVHDPHANPGSLQYGVTSVSLGLRAISDLHWRSTVNGFNLKAPDTIFFFFLNRTRT